MLRQTITYQNIQLNEALNFEQLYRQYCDRVFNLCLNYTFNTEDAQELAQDVFVKVHESLGNFKGDSRVSTWIYRITVNHCKDFIKSKNRQKRFALLKSLFHPVTNEPIGAIHFDHPGVQLENKESVEKIMGLIDGLSEKQKTALILTKMEGLPQSEVADIMGLGVKAVESLVFRAKESIEKSMNLKRRM